jgi:hypothetical protein
VVGSASGTRYIGNIDLGTKSYDLTYGGATFSFSFQDSGPEDPLMTGNASADFVFDETGSNAGYVSLFSESQSIGAVLSGGQSWVPGFSAKKFEDSGDGFTWDGGAYGYIAVRLNQGDNNYNYGWLEIDYNDAANTLTIGAMAFETSFGQSIQAGAVPEPSTYALLSGAAILGFVLLRRHRMQPKPL